MIDDRTFRVLLIFEFQQNIDLYLDMFGFYANCKDDIGPQFDLDILGE